MENSQLWRALRIAPERTSVLASKIRGPSAIKPCRLKAALEWPMVYHTPTHKELSQSGLSFSGEISFWSTHVFAQVEELFFFHDDMCSLRFRSHDEEVAHYDFETLAKQLGPASNYLSGRHAVYSTYVDTLVQLVLRPRSFRFDPIARVLRLEGDWIDAAGDRESETTGFHGSLQGVQNSSGPVSRQRILEFLKDFKS